MAGGAYDPTPVSNDFVSPDLPDANRIVLTCGLSIKPLPRFTILAALEGVTSVTRDGYYEFGNFRGLYKTEALTPGLGVYYNF
jgi:long-chain fatty acid transport protein